MKKGLNVGAGVIDVDYTGEVKVVIFNHSNEDAHIKRGDRVAQLILECIKTLEIMEIEEKKDTIRGDKGFGSTNTLCVINEQEMEQIVWKEHLKAHWGAYKTYMALKKKGINIPY